MRKIGLIGGTSWHSTADYYGIINELVNKELGGNHSAKLMIESLDLQEIEDLMNAGEWSTIGMRLTRSAFRLSEGGAKAIVICTNTLHKVVDQVQYYLGGEVPIIHVGTVTAKAVKRRRIKTVCFLGTKFTMEDDFIIKEFEKKNIKVIVPDETEREFVNEVIFKQLCRGIVNPSSRTAIECIIKRTRSHGAEGVVLACTELSMIVNEEGAGIPVFDTMSIHAQAAADFILST
ncbi:MAG: amino acid racemase [Candidatus Paceibacterota bacterium]